mgnify:CR=1 FL=1
MAKLEQTLYEDFDHLLNRIEDGIKAGSSSATLEEFSDFAAGNSRCSVRVFERYSLHGRQPREPERNALSGRRWTSRAFCNHLRRQSGNVL